MAYIDHIVIAVREPQTYTEYLLSQFGLGSYHGGRLAGIGTESHIVPLGEGFLDLVSIVDEREASSNPFGRAVLAATQEDEAKFITWAINLGQELQLKAEQLDLPLSSLKRALPDGGHASCRVVGLQQAVEAPPLPYFVDWATKAERPDNVVVDHISDPMGFAWVEVAGKKDRLQGWLQGSMVPLQFASGPGPDCIDAIGILTEGDAIVIRSPLGSGLAGVSGEQSLPSPVARFQSPYKEQELSTFAVVLDSIEQAIETAAVAVETMAGGVSSPEDLRTAPGKSDE